MLLKGRDKDRNRLEDKYGWVQLLGTGYEQDRQNLEEPEMSLSSELARKIANAAVDLARERSFKPIAVVVGDQSGRLRAAIVEDNCPTARFGLAYNKIRSVAALGMDTDILSNFAQTNTAIFEALQQNLEQPLLPVGGGCGIRDANGVLIGAIGVSGETPENDKSLAEAAIAAVLGMK
jgi:uncharacterized protein GlcG (DUF336 family)